MAELKKEEPAFEELKKEVLARRGFDLNQYSQEYVKRRMNARIMVLGLSRDSWSEYRELLHGDEKEYAALFDTFSINVTEFYRDTSVWRMLQNDILPKLINEKKNAKPSVLRIWSAGCSTGEEPYSLAILLKELMPPGNTIQLAFIATDIDIDAVRRAREGIFKREALKGVATMNPEWIKKYFTPLGTLSAEGEALEYQVIPELRRMVIFKEHNFLSDAPFIHIDAIFCRNAMIYLTPQVKEELIGTFFASLIPNGLLVIGKSEIIFLGKGRYFFYPVNTIEHIYRKERRKVEPKDFNYPGPERRGKWWWGHENEKSEEK